MANPNQILPWLQIVAIIGAGFIVFVTMGNTNKNLSGNLQELKKITQNHEIRITTLETEGS